MRNLILRAVAAACLLVYGVASQGQAPGLVRFVSSQLEDATGTVIANATLSAQIVVGATPASVRLGSGGQASMQPVTVQVVNGMIASPTFYLPDVNLTSPQNVCIAVTVTDNTSGSTLISDPCVQPSSSTTSPTAQQWCSTTNSATTCNFDLYTPNFAPQALIQTGPQGPQGTPGCTVGNGSCNTVVDTTPAGNQTVTQPAGTALNIAGSTLLNGKPGCAADGSGCASNPRAAHVGQSADASIKAENGSSEQFFADLHPVGSNPDGSQMAPGFDAETNVQVSQGTFTCKSCSAGNAVLTRALTTPNPTSFTAQAEMHFVSGDTNIWGCIGFTNAAPGVESTLATQRAMTCVNSYGAYLDTPAGSIQLFNPLLGPGWYDVSMSLFSNGCYRVGLTAHGTTASTNGEYCGSQVSVPTPLNNFESIVGSANNAQRNIRYSAGSDGSSSTYLNMPYSATAQNLTMSLPILSIDGGTFFSIPPAYKQGVKNPWVLYLHGYNEYGYSTSLAGSNAGVASVTLSLLQAGYVVVGINNTVSSCWGNAQCVTDVQTVIQQATSMFSLEDQPYLVSDSMGGFQMLNAVAQGVVHPRAMVGWCDGTSLAWIYANGGAPGLINTAYNVSASNPYAVATAGYDPMLDTGAALANLVAVPAQFWASYGDTVESKAANADAYAAMINAAGGNVVVNTSTGNHEDPSNFNGPAVVAFFNAH